MHFVSTRMRSLLLFFALACTANGQTTKCPPPYHVIGTGCYTFPDVALSWIEALIFCQFSRGYLANIESEDEQMALQDYHYANILTMSGANRWIGATDMLSNGTWRWVPSGTTFVYNNWEAQHPIPKPSADCAYWRPYYVWDDWFNELCCTVSGIQPLCEADPL